MSFRKEMLDVTAEIITIGDELLYGQTIDTNAAFIGSKLSEIGISLNRITTISDKKEAIINALNLAKETAKVILITGGLGPTNDDITKKTLVEFFDTKLVENKSVLKDLEELFENKSFGKIEDNLNQMWLPENAIKLTNKVGTAPGMWFEEDGVIFVSMPGVPREMRYLMENEIAPKLQRELQLPIIEHVIINTVGVAEIKVSQMISDIEEELPKHISLAYLPSLAKVKLRLTAKGIDKKKLQDELETFKNAIVSRIEKYVFGFGKITLEEAIGEQLTQKKRTISTAESCTGGKLANTLLTVPGSSSYFQASIVAYSYEAKHNLLGVKKETLASVGAVSEECAIEMAEGVREKLGVDIGVSSTGIAGPGGGTIDKPVGTVWIAYADGKNTVAKQLNLGDNGRMTNIEYTTIACLNLIRKNIE